jgi:beta-lactamase regulating signal transducer with metallopeptidase domain
MEALIGVLVECSVRAAIIAGAVACVLYGFRIKSPAILRRIWAGVLAAMLCLPLIAVWSPRIAIPLPVRKTTSLVPSVSAPVAIKVQPKIDPSAEIPIAAPLQYGAEKNTGRHWSVYAVVGAFYLVGVFLFLSRMLLGMLLSYKLFRRAVKDKRGFWRSRCAAPLTVGILRPRIFLPEESQFWDEAAIASILMHEQEHVRRFDPFIEWLALLNRSVYWFHPLAWWLCRKLASLAEFACDEAVIAGGRNRSDYAELLLNLARSVRRKGSLITEWGSSIHGSTLRQRICRIVEAAPSPLISRPQAAFIAGLCFIVILAPTICTLIPKEAAAWQSNPAIALPAPPDRPIVEDNARQSNAASKSPATGSIPFKACFVDGQTKEAVHAGRVAIRNRTDNSVVIEKELDGDGCIAHSLLPGRYSILPAIQGFRLNGYTDQEIEPNQAPIKRIVELIKPILIKGIVKNAALQPQPNAAVILYRTQGVAENAIGGAAMPVRTNVSGEFIAELENKESGIMIFAAKSPGSMTQSGPFDINAIGNRQIEIVLPKEEEIMRSGLILDSNQHPVQGATIEFVPIFQNKRRLSLLWSFALLVMPKTTSDASGHFSLPVLSASPGYLRVTAKGLRGRFVLGHEELIMLDIPSLFSVRVEDEKNNPVSGLSIRGDVNSALEKNKYYTVGSNPYVYAEGIRNNLGLTNRKSVVSPDEEVVLKLGNCNLQGQAVDEQGKPIENILIEFQSLEEDEKGPPWDLRFSAVPYYTPDGSFRVKNLIPGKYSLVIWGKSQGNSISAQLSAVLNEGQTTSIRAVLKPRVGLEYHLQP